MSVQNKAVHSRDTIDRLAKAPSVSRPGGNIFDDLVALPLAQETALKQVYVETLEESNNKGGGYRDCTYYRACLHDLYALSD